jgi:hypothetical protein
MRKPMYLLALLGLAVTLFGADPFSGTWKLNIAKSKFPAGRNPAPKEITAVIREQVDETEVTVKGTAVDGSPIAAHYTVPPKRKGALKSAEDSAGSTVTSRRIDDRTIDSATTRDGKQIQTSHSVVSRDGKTLRMTIRGFDSQGKPVEEGYQVYEKQ